MSNKKTKYCLQMEQANYMANTHTPLWNWQSGENNSPFILILSFMKDFVLCARAKNLWLCCRRRFSLIFFLNPPHISLLLLYSIFCLFRLCLSWNCLLLLPSQQVLSLSLNLCLLHTHSTTPSTPYIFCLCTWIVFGMFDSVKFFPTSIILSARILQQ